MTAAIATPPPKQTTLSVIPAEEPKGPPLDHNSATVNIPVSKIVRSPWNRHSTVTDELVDHIRANGVIQNIVVRKIKATVAHVTEFAGKAPQPFALGEDIYQLVAGERRWLGAKKAGRPTIPAVIRELTDTQAMELQVAENEHREDLNPMDRHRAYAQLVRQYQEDHKADPRYTRKNAVADVAQKLKKEPRTIYQVLQLEDLTPFIKAMLESGELPLSHGYELCRRPAEEQERLLRWLKEQREHSHGDLPSVRRLKREVELIDRENEEKKAQKKLFDEGEKIAGAPGKALSGNDGSGAASKSEAASAPVKGKGPCPDPIGHIMRYAAAQTSAPGEWTCGLCNAINTARNRVKCGNCGCEKGSVPAPTTKPLTEAARKRIEEQQRKREEADRKQRLLQLREDKIEKRSRVALLLKMAAKLQPNHRTLLYTLPGLIQEAWDDGDFGPEIFGPALLGWPEPKNKVGDSPRYSFQEVKAYAKKHNKKFTFGLLATLLLYNRSSQAETERLARYFQIDPKKLRKKAAEEVKEEDRKAKAKKDVDA